MSSKFQEHKVAIWGYGSIGRRHAGVFKDLGAQVAIVSRRDIDHQKHYNDMETCLNEFNPGFIVVASATHEHFQAVEFLQKREFMGKVLVEKPLYQHAKVIECVEQNLFVAYNLRFNPILLALKERLREKKVISALVYCGQHLSSWRPQRDYRSCYSASSKMGGGVLRDLSHEVDYSFWLFGWPERLTSLGGKFSNLEIDSDDSYSILMKNEKCESLNISVNYLDFSTKRFIMVNCKDESITADLIKGELSVNNELVYKSNKVDTYTEQANALLSGNVGSLCGYRDGLRLVETLELIEEAANKEEWIKL